MNKITPYKTAIKSIEGYLEKSPWAERFQENTDFYITELSKQLDISESEMFEKIKNESASGYMYGIAFESLFDKEYGNFHNNIIDEYIKRRGWKLSKDEKNIFEHLRNEPFSIYEVIEATPGESLIIQDILANSGEIKVFEKSGSMSIKPFDFIVAKVIKEDNKYGFTGCLFKISTKDAKRIQNKVKEALNAKSIVIKENEVLSEEINQKVNRVLRMFTPEIFISAFKYVLTPSKYVTYEGDDIAPAEITFTVNDRKKVINKLNKHEDLYIAAKEPDDPFWNWAVDKKILSPVKRDGIILETFLENDLMVIGNIELIGKTLKCSAMSEIRTKNLINLLQDYLGGLISMPVIKYVDIFQKSQKLKTKN